MEASAERSQVIYWGRTDPPSTAAPVAPESPMPTFPAGLVAQPQGQCGAKWVPVLFVRARRARAEAAAKATTPVQCGNEDAQVSLHRAPRSEYVQPRIETT